jgi:thiol-disulfide isomerase/thioredoxin
MSKYVSEVSDSSFESDVLQSDKPVLVDFWADWCAPCRMLTPTIETVAEKYAATARIEPSGLTALRGARAADADSLQERQGRGARRRHDLQRGDLPHDRQAHGKSFGMI